MSEKKRSVLYNSVLLRVVVLVLLLNFLVLFPTASANAAPTCRMTGEHTICILTIKRSAKNYWEYRASVKVDDQVRPVEVYNCRDRTKINSKGQVTRFQEDGAGAMICQLLYR